MFRLFESGMQPGEIARACFAGTASIEPFEIPRRSVHDIVTRMARESGQEAPQALEDADSPDAIRRFPERIAAILGREMARLEAKGERRLLGSADYERLRMVNRLSYDVEKRLRSGDLRSAASPSRSKPRRSAGSLLERLRKEEREAQREQENPSCTHARPDPA